MNIKYFFSHKKILVENIYYLEKWKEMILKIEKAETKIRQAK